MFVLITCGFPLIHHRYRTDIGLIDRKRHGAVLIHYAHDTLCSVFFKIYYEYWRFVPLTSGPIFTQCTFLGPR
jgi:hypothetical protein